MANSHRSAEGVRAFVEESRIAGDVKSEVTDSRSVGRRYRGWSRLNPKVAAGNVPDRWMSHRQFNALAGTRRKLFRSLPPTLSRRRIVAAGYFGEGSLRASLRKNG